MLLRRATTAVGGIGLAAASVRFSYWMPSADTEAAAAPIKVDISSLQPRQQLTIPWRGMPIWVISRDKEMLDSIQQSDSYLRDPFSEQDQQPNYCKTQRAQLSHNFLSRLVSARILAASPPTVLMQTASRRIGWVDFIVRVTVLNMI